MLPSEPLRRQRHYTIQKVEHLSTSRTRMLDCYKIPYFANMALSRYALCPHIKQYGVRPEIDAPSFVWAIEYTTERDRRVRIGSLVVCQAVHDALLQLDPNNMDKFRALLIDMNAEREMIF